MSSSNERVLPPGKIPKSLWEAPHLTLPESLRVGYEAELSGIGLLQVARDGTKERGILEERLKKKQNNISLTGLRRPLDV